MVVIMIIDEIFDEIFDEILEEKFIMISVELFICFKYKR